MSVETETRSGSYVSDGSLTPRSIGFPFLDAADIAVTVDGVARVLNVHYEIDGNFPAATLTPYAGFAVSGQTVAYRRFTSARQDYGIAGTEIRAKALESALDRAAMVGQDQNGLLQQALMVPFGETSLPLPPVSQRANTFAAFDGAGALVGVSLNPSLAVAGTLLATSRIVLANLSVPSDGQNVWLSELGRVGMFEWRSGDYRARVAADPYQGIYVRSALVGPLLGCWVRNWDWCHGFPEWFGVVPDNSVYDLSNDARIAACYALCPKTLFGPNDYFFTQTVRANIENHCMQGVGENYTGRNTAVTRLLLTNGTETLMQLGADVFPGSINGLPQGIHVSDMYVGRTVPPVIASGARGVVMLWALVARLENVKTAENMVGIEALGCVHSFQRNCSSVRASAGTGSGTDYFIGNYANGGGGLAAGGNASLYIFECSASCDYGPLQTASGTRGFKADQGFTDVWYWNPETTNCYIAQELTGTDATGVVFENTDFQINHPIHDQFKFAGLLITNVASSGSAEIITPYFGPSPGARACYWVSSSEGAVSVTSGQFVMSVAPTAQAIVLDSSRGCDVLGFPKILEHGNEYPVCGVYDVQDARIEVFGKNPNVTGASVVKLFGTCKSVVVIPKCSGKPGAFSCGIEVATVNDNDCEYQVSGLNSTSLVSAAAKLVRNGVPVTAAVMAGSFTAFGSFG